MMIVKMFDAENGATKVLRSVVSVSMYNGEVRVKDNQDVVYCLPADELEHHCVYIADDVQCVDDWGE